MKAKLILSNGAVFEGLRMGAARDCVCELVFHTAMVGYQELLTDPACVGQGLVMTYPLIGNYGVNAADAESPRCWAEALIVRRLSPRGSNFRCEGTLEDYLLSRDVPGICGVDTRAITRMLREQGCMNAMLTSQEDIDMAYVQELLAAYRTDGRVRRVSCKSVQRFGSDTAAHRVALYDFGATQSLIRALTGRGCQVTVFPDSTPAENILRGGFDGVVLAGGPGDPATEPALAAQCGLLLQAGIPLFGISLGHLLLATAAGGQTEKLHYGHRGSNLPVRDLATGRVYITSQNHGYGLQEGAVPASAASVSFRNVHDGTIEGLDYSGGRAFSVQFQPDDSDGAAGTGWLYARFIELMGGTHNA